MPETLTCPACQKKVRLPDHLIGKRVKCPNCGGTFTATSATVPSPVVAPVPEPEPFEPEPMPPPPPPPLDEEKRQDNLAFPRDTEVDIPPAEVSAWFGVRTGLLVQVVAHAALAGGVLLTLLLTLIALGSSSPSRDGKFLIILTGLAGLALHGGWILSVAAGCFVLGTPPRRSAGGLAVGTLLMSALIVLTAANLPALTGVGRGGEGPAGAAIITLYLIEVARLTLLALLLRALCLNLGQSKLGGNAQLLALLTFCIMLGMFVLVLLIIVLAGPMSPTVGTILLDLIFAAWIGVLVFGLIVMLGLKQKLDRKLPRTEPG